MPHREVRHARARLGKNHKQEEQQDSVFLFRSQSHMSRGTNGHSCLQLSCSCAVVQSTEKEVMTKFTFSHHVSNSILILSEGR